ncbi:MAG: hypothetical protein WCG78_03005 [Candidatus Omnitrophota bacterium]
MESIKIFAQSDKIKWGIPESSISFFSAEENCRIPFTDFSGVQEVCRYEKEVSGVRVYVTPVFKPTLIGFKACFEPEQDLSCYKKICNEFTAQNGQPAYSIKEKWEGQDLRGYPCNIWILADAILELGIHEENFVVLGYALLTKKDRYREIYTESYLGTIGWKPPKGL